MQERIEDDYSDLLKIEVVEVMEFVEPGKEYVCYVEDLIRNWEENKGWSGSIDNQFNHW